MKLLDKLAKRFAKNASSTVKSEVKKTAIDLLPTVIGIVSMVVGIVIFKGAVEEPERPALPMVTNSTMTTNNYFFGNMSEDAILRILDSGEED